MFFCRSEKNLWKYKEKYNLIKIISRLAICSHILEYFQVDYILVSC